MNTQITIKLHGENITLKLLADAMTKTNALLSELDQIANHGERTTEWDVAGLRSGSAEYSVTPRLIDASATDNTEHVLALFDNGIKTLEERAERPREFTDRALDCARDLASIVGQGIEKMTYRMKTEGRLSNPTVVSLRIAANAGDVLGSRRKSFGSVEGIVELLDGYKNRVGVQDRLTGHKVVCECHKDTLTDLASNHWEKLVIVTGEITEDRAGHAKSIKVKHYRSLRNQSELPQPEDLLGLYVRKQDA